ncbi:hypothetical protein MRB53_011901 [Persea americana]|uniref:Uncharacterized protein n=1 Tax=Persea americana TaxID=3435 RepID=A0ACC2LX73_PERAE|nr:hypothetical protein MRB53_011901 [Persea americana]
MQQRQTEFEAGLRAVLDSLSLMPWRCTQRTLGSLFFHSVSSVLSLSFPVLPAHSLSQPAVWPAYRQWCNGFNRIISFTTACRYSSFPKSSTFTISPSAGCSWFYCGLLLSLHRASAAPSGCTPAAPAPTWSSRPRTNTSKMLKMATSVGKKLSVERRK